MSFIDYSAAFDTESQMFLDEALAEAGVGAKVRRIVQAIFAAATGVVCLRHPDGTMTLSEPFDIARGVLQGDIFSPVYRRTGPDLPDAGSPKPRRCRGREYDHHVEVRVRG